MIHRQRFNLTSFPVELAIKRFFIVRGSIGLKKMAKSSFGIGPLHSMRVRVQSTECPLESIECNSITSTLFIYLQKQFVFCTTTFYNEWLKTESADGADRRIFEKYLSEKRAIQADWVYQYSTRAGTRSFSRWKLEVFFSAAVLASSSPPPSPQGL